MESCFSKFLFEELINDLPILKDRISFMGYCEIGYRFKIKGEFKFEVGGFLSYMFQRSINAKIQNSGIFKTFVENMANKLFEAMIKEQLIIIDTIDEIKKRFNQKFNSNDKDHLKEHLKIKEEYASHNWSTYFVFHNLELWETLPLENLFRKQNIFEENQIYFEKSYDFTEEKQFLGNQELRDTMMGQLVSGQRYKNTIDGINSINDKLQFPLITIMRNEFMLFWKNSSRDVFQNFLSAMDNNLITEIYNKTNG